MLTINKGYRSCYSTFILILFTLLQACAIPDNLPFSRSEVKSERLSAIKRVALLDVVPPKNIVLGSLASDAQIWLLGLPLAVYSEGDEVTSGKLVSNTARVELKAQLEEVGVEVILVEARRDNEFKMLDSYEQFSELNVDAILEVATSEAGFKYDIGKLIFRESKRPVSPEASFIYRLVVPGTSEVLVESNISHSSFPSNYKNLKGVKSLGRHEHIFKNEDAVLANPEEAIERLQYAIRKAAFLIAQVVTDNCPSCFPSWEYPK